MASKVINYKGQPKAVLEVDDEDSEILDKTWYMDFSNRHRGSEYFRIKRPSTLVEKSLGYTAHIKIHNEVWCKHNGPIQSGFVVDHLDHNTLNNRKENLVLRSHVDNSKRIRKEFVPVFIS